MTLGPALLTLAWTERAPARWVRPLIVFGRVPLFYFALHFAVLHVLAVMVCAVLYGSAHWMFESPDLAHYPSRLHPDGGSRCRWSISCGSRWSLRSIRCAAGSRRSRRSGADRGSAMYDDRLVKLQRIQLFSS